MLNPTNYAGLLVFLGLGIVFMLMTMAMSSALRERSTDPARGTTYECGMETIGSPWVSPNIRFYVFALLFVVFDIEAVFILPWAVAFKELGLPGLVSVGVFLGVLFTGLIIAWRKGALTWE